MSYDLVFPLKGIADEITLEFPFLNQLQFGENITGQVTVATVFQGIDPAPDLIVSDAATTDGTTVRQVVTGGLSGVIYYLVATVSTNLGHILTQGARLAVADTADLFNPSP